MPRIPRRDITALRLRLEVDPRWQGVTQDGLAQLLGVPVQTVRDWEHGRRKPDAAGRRLLALLDAAPAEMLAAISKLRVRQDITMAVP